jgi:chemotaxis protein CheC
MNEFCLNLTPLQMDALKEVGNIGAGNAATALSRMVSRRIDVTIPTVKIIQKEKISEVTTDSDANYVALFFEVLGDATGNMFLLFSESSAYPLLDMLMGRRKGETKGIQELEEAAFKEVGNIIAASYLNSLTKFLGMPIIPGDPTFSYDILKSILEAIPPQIRFSEYALMWENEFIESQTKIKGQLYFVPTLDSLYKILRTLGLAENTCEQ